MAIVTSDIASFNDNQVLVQIDWNNVNRNIIRARIINSSAQPAMFHIIKPSLAIDYTLTVLGGQTVAHAVPNNLTFLWLDDGDGQGFNINWGDIHIYCGWPA